MNYNKKRKIRFGGYLHSSGKGAFIIYLCVPGVLLVRVLG